MRRWPPSRPAWRRNLGQVGGDRRVVMAIVASAVAGRLDGGSRCGEIIGAAAWERAGQITCRSSRRPMPASRCNQSTPAARNHRSSHRRLGRPHLLRRSAPGRFPANKCAQRTSAADLKRSARPTTERAGRAASLSTAPAVHAITAMAEPAPQPAVIWAGTARHVWRCHSSQLSPAKHLACTMIRIMRVIVLLGELSKSAYMCQAPHPHTKTINTSGHSL